MSLPSDDLETLQRQKDELLRKKEEKQRQLSQLLPENLRSLNQQRESLLAKKLEKERHLAELMRKQELVTSRSNETLSKSGKKRGRSITDEEVEISGSLKREAGFHSIDEKQFQELRKEHKRNRKLIRDQYHEFEVISHYALQRVDYLQKCLNLIMNHLGLQVAALPDQSENIPEDEHINILADDSSLPHSHHILPQHCENQPTQLNSSDSIISPTLEIETQGTATINAGTLEIAEKNSESIFPETSSQPRIDHEIHPHQVTASISEFTVCVQSCNDGEQLPNQAQQMEVDTYRS